MAIYDRGTTQAAAAQDVEIEDESDALSNALKGVSGFAIDESVHDNLAGQDEDDVDQLALAALEALNAVEALAISKQPSIQHFLIPSDNLLKLLELLLLIAPIDLQEPLSTYSDQLCDIRLEDIRKTAGNILWGFGIEKRPGISYKTFEAVVSCSLPYMFDSLSPLFEHFLFERSMDQLLQRDSSGATMSGTRQLLSSSSEKSKSSYQLLVPEGGDVLSYAILTQLSFFIPPPSLFHRLHRLYAGSSHGFSLSSFSSHVLNWHGPTILLISGTLLPAMPANSRERAFADMLPPLRSPQSSRGSHPNSRRVIYGAYITVPWKHSHRECFGNAETRLFQLEPVHDVFRASTVARDYVALTTSPSPRAGLHVGSPMQLSTAPTTPLGPVSLYIDDGLEYGVFTHTLGGGGSIHSSASPWRSGTDWQDRFEVEALEVWGCGGKEEAERQLKAQEFEEREAKLRRQINVGGTGDVDADRELLRMAGLVGHGQEGGSMG